MIAPTVAIAKPSILNCIPPVLSIVGLVGSIALHYSGAVGSLAAYGFSATAITIATGLPLVVGIIGALVVFQNTPKRLMESIQQNKEAKPYNPVGQEAIAFAEKKLHEHLAKTSWLPSMPFFSGNSSYSNKRQPTNNAIIQLADFYWNVSFKKFEAALKEGGEKPWGNQEVLESAHECMKISYAIGALTLDDLEPFTQELLNERKGELKAALKKRELMGDMRFDIKDLSDVLKNQLNGALKSELTNDLGPFTQELFDELKSRKTDESYSIEKFFNDLDAEQPGKLDALIVSLLTRLKDGQDSDPDLKKLLPERFESLASVFKFTKALTHQEYYQYRTFYLCTEIYHRIRSGDQTPISEEHAELFYKSNTIQGQCRALYNDYCRRIRYYVCNNELFEADKRHARWTVEDLDSSKFKSWPDSLPT